MSRLSILYQQLSSYDSETYPFYRFSLRKMSAMAHIELLISVSGASVEIESCVSGKQVVRNGHGLQGVFRLP